MVLMNGFLLLVLAAAASPNSVAAEARVHSAPVSHSIYAQAERHGSDNHHHGSKADCLTVHSTGCFSLGFALARPASALAFGFSRFRLDRAGDDLAHGLPPTPPKHPPCT
tara:strand:- start:1024 stop:1353 length:330 start_codon:yes stop_codon:yes gene_type:complete